MSGEVKQARFENVSATTRVHGIPSGTTKGTQARQRALRSPCKARAAKGTKMQRCKLVCDIAPPPCYTPQRFANCDNSAKVPTPIHRGTQSCTRNREPDGYRFIRTKMDDMYCKSNQRNDSDRISAKSQTTQVGHDVSQLRVIPRVSGGIEELSPQVARCCRRS